MKRPIAFPLFGLTLAGLALSAILSPMPAARAAVSAEAETIARVEDYLNGIKTLHSRFVQVASNGDYAEGDVFVDRPGRLRFEYDPPSPVLLIANGLSLLYYDKELRQSSFVPLWETPLWFLMREDVKLSGGVEVTKVGRGAGTLSVTLQEKKAEGAGAVTLRFSDNPLTLRKWEITDPQGITTEVALVNPKFGVKIDRDMFDHRNLKGRDQPRRR